MNLREKALLVALGRVGIRERGGNNRGPEVERWQREAGIRPGDPWCAAFVNACARQAADALFVLSPLESVPLQGYVQSYFEHFAAQGCIVSPQYALPGDLFVIYYPHLKRYGHIGFVGWDGVDLKRKRYDTCEGNSNDAGSREGDAVVRKSRVLGRHVRFLRWTRVVQAKPQAA